MFGGAAPQIVLDEKGNQRQMPAKEIVNFFIYLESPANDVQVKEIWLKQKPYAAKEVITVSTPVVMKGQGPLVKPDTLVHATRSKVLQLTLGPGVQPPKVGAAAQKKIKGNEVVIRCMINGKEQYFTAAAIKNLPPVALQ